MGMESVCQVCKRPSDMLVCVFQLDEFDAYDVKRDGPLPMQICKSCGFDALTSHGFKQQYEQNPNELLGIEETNYDMIEPNDWLLMSDDSMDNSCEDTVEQQFETAKNSTNLQKDHVNFQVDFKDEELSIDNGCEDTGIFNDDFEDDEQIIGNGCEDTVQQQFETEKNSTNLQKDLENFQVDFKDDELSIDNGCEDKGIFYDDFEDDEQIIVYGCEDTVEQQFETEKNSTNLQKDLVNFQVDFKDDEQRIDNGCEDTGIFYDDFEDDEQRIGNGCEDTVQQQFETEKNSTNLQKDLVNFQVDFNDDEQRIDNGCEDSGEQHFESEQISTNLHKDPLSFNDYFEASELVKHSKKKLRINKVNFIIDDAVTMHCHTGHLCHVCGLLFSYRSQLNEHLPKHSNEKPFKCDQCPKVYKRYPGLVLHMRKHNVKRSHQCPYCWRIFAYGGCLKNHIIKRHTIIMEPVCLVCKRASDDLVDIFQDEAKSQLEPYLLDLLNKFGACDVIRDDPLSTQICQSCVLDAQTAYSLKRKYEDNHKTVCEPLEREESNYDVMESDDSPMLSADTIDNGCEDTAEQQLESERGSTNLYNDLENCYDDLDDDEQSMDNGCEDRAEQQLESDGNSTNLYKDLENFHGDFADGEQSMDNGCEDTAEQQLESDGNSTNLYKDLENCYDDLDDDEQSMDNGCEDTAEQQLESDGNSTNLYKDLENFHGDSADGEQSMDNGCEDTAEQQLESEGNSTNLYKPPVIFHDVFNNGDLVKDPNQELEINKENFINDDAVAMRCSKGHLCTVCGVTFAYRSQLNTHLPMHSKERPFKCHQCDKTYKRSKGLKVHMRIHDVNLSLQCPHCSKTFASAEYPNHHALVHTDKIQCVYCSRCFKDSTQLRTHIVNWH